MYTLTPEQASLVDRVSELADRTIAPRAAEVDATGAYPAQSLEALGREGFLGLTISQQYGGMGEDTRAMCAVLDAVARRCASTAMCYLMHLAGVAAYQSAPRPPVDLLQKAAQGKHLCTLAWSEFGSRSHFWAPVSQLRRNGNKMVLDARKSFVTSASQADGFVVSTRSETASAPTDTTLVLILKNDPGVQVAGSWNGLGMRGNGSAPMHFHVEVDASRALSEPGKGLESMLGAVLPVFNPGIAAIAIGISEAAVAVTAKHLTSARFEYLNTGLADLPVERARLAEMRMRTDMARAHLDTVLRLAGKNDPATMLFILESKAAAAETAVMVTDIALRACGGTGFSRHLGVDRLFRDARAASVMSPTSDVLYEFIGRSLCGMEVFS